MKVADKKTTIIVSHRISSAKNADKIFILDKGQIASARISQSAHKSRWILQRTVYRAIGCKRKLTIFWMISFFFHF